MSFFLSSPLIVSPDLLSNYQKNIKGTAINKNNRIIIIIRRRRRRRRRIRIIIRRRRIIIIIKIIEKGSYV